MTALLDIQHIVVGYYRTDVSVGFGYIGKRKQAVQLGYLVGVDLDGLGVIHQRCNQLVVQLGLQRQNLIFGPQYLFFVLLQFLRDVSLGVHQRLLAYPFGRHLILVGVPHLDVITEHIVVGYLQTRNARLFDFTLLNLQEIIFSGIGNPTQLVQFFIHSVGDDSPLVDQQRRVVLDFAGYLVADGLTRVQQSPYPVQACVGSMQTSRLDGFDGL